MQARARRTREKILAQAKRAFSERGFEATNLTEHILTPAGVSVGSFYHQFTNKREVLLEIFELTIRARRERLAVHLADMEAASFADGYRQVLNLLMDDLEADPEIWRIQWREHESPDPEIRERALMGIPGWTDVVIRMMADYFGEDARMPLVAEATVLLAAGMLREYSHLSPERQAARRAELVDICVDVIEATTNALLPPR